MMNKADAQRMLPAYYRCLECQAEVAGMEPAKGGQRVHFDCGGEVTVSPRGQYGLRRVNAPVCGRRDRCE